MVSHRYLLYLCNVFVGPEPDQEVLLRGPCHLSHSDEDPSPQVSTAAESMFVKNLQVGIFTSNNLDDHNYKKPTPLRCGLVY